MRALCKIAVWSRHPASAARTRLARQRNTRSSLGDTSMWTPTLRALRRWSYWIAQRCPRWDSVRGVTKLWCGVYSADRLVAAFFRRLTVIKRKKSSPRSSNVPSVLRSFQAGLGLSGIGIGIHVEVRLLMRMIRFPLTNW